MAVAELLETGTLEHVGVIAKRITGRRPTPSTIWRWCTQGLRGGRIRLACAFHAGRWCTTEDAFRAFIEAQTQAQIECPPSKYAVASDAALRAAGLL